MKSGLNKYANYSYQKHTLARLSVVSQPHCTPPYSIKLAARALRMVARDHRRRAELVHKNVMTLDARTERPKVRTLITRDSRATIALTFAQSELRSEAAALRSEAVALRVAVT
jgi:hypothetical protein